MGALFTCFSLTGFKNMDDDFNDDDDDDKNDRPGDDGTLRSV